MYSAEDLQNSEDYINEQLELDKINKAKERAEKITIRYINIFFKNKVTGVKGIGYIRINSEQGKSISKKIIAKQLETIYQDYKDINFYIQTNGNEYILNPDTSVITLSLLKNLFVNRWSVDNNDKVFFCEHVENNAANADKIDAVINERLRWDEFSRRKESRNWIFEKANAKTYYDYVIMPLNHETRIKYLFTFK